MAEAFLARIDDETFSYLQRVRPWERQQGESGQRYEAFRRWSDLAPGARSLRVLAREVGQPLEVIEMWHQNDSWALRAESRDTYIQATLDREQSEILRGSMLSETEKIIRARRKAISLGAASLDKHFEQEARIPAGVASNISTKEAISLIEFGRELLELGEKSTESEIDLSQLSDEEFELYSRLRAKARAPRK